jgi:hypothetical protein
MDHYLSLTPEQREAYDRRTAEMSNGLFIYEDGKLVSPYVDSSSQALQSVKL